MYNSNGGAAADGHRAAAKPLDHFMAERLVSSGLTAEQDYALETAGYIVIPDALSPVELSAFVLGRAQAHDTEATADRYAAMCRQDGPLAVHPVLTSYLGAIIGSEWHAAEPLRVLGSWHAGLKEKPSRVPLHPGSMNPPRPGYAIQNGGRHCRALTAVWALTDTVPGGGYIVLSASHKSTVAIPRSFRDGTGLEWLEQRGIALEPQLRAGSLMLVVSGVLHGLRPGMMGDTSSRHDGRQRLVECQFRKGAAPLSAEALAELPSLLPWTAALSPRQQQIVGAVAAPQDSSAAPPSIAGEAMVVDDTETLREVYMWDLCVRSRPVCESCV